jgi:hypothetical protein
LIGLNALVRRLGKTNDLALLTIEDFIRWTFAADGMEGPRVIGFIDVPSYGLEDIPRIYEQMAAPCRSRTALTASSPSPADIPSPSCAPSMIR